MLYTIHIHPALSTLRGKVTWRGWEMQGDTLQLDESIRLEKLMADDTPVVLSTGKKEGSKWVYSLLRAREYTLEYSASLEGRFGESDFLFLDAYSPLLPHLETKGVQEVVLYVPQSYSAQSSLNRESLTREDGIKRYFFSGEGEWILSLARYMEIPFLSGEILLLKDTSAVIAQRALEEAVDLVSKRFARPIRGRINMAALPDTMTGRHTPGGVFVEQRAFDELSELPLLMERFFDVPWLLKSPPEEGDYLQRQMKDYLISESLQQVLSASQLEAVGVKPTSLLREAREFLGSDAFDKLLQLILSKYEGRPLSKVDFVREFDELSWMPGTGEFLQERMK